jgi:sigma-B regulation protein RsbU (phosphoserine phosphatase)
MTQFIKVLVVEDNAGDAQLIAAALNESAHPRFLASFSGSIKAAQDHLQAADAPDIILLDLTLPDVTGKETLIRMREASPRIPIIIMTGFDDAPFAEHMVALGAQDYLVKGDFTGPMLWRSIVYAITRMHSIIERDEMLSQLTDAIEAKKRLFGILAHDLRNPISVISGYADLLEISLGAKIDDQPKLWINNIRSSVHQAVSLIKDVLSMAMSEASEITLNTRPVDITKLVVQAVERNNLLGQKKGVKTQTVLPQVGIPMIHGDAIKLNELLNNLIGNAIKFSYPGGKVEVSITKEKEAVRLTVADQGVGVAPEVHASLFQPFCRGKSGTAGESTNGLGLYICAQIVAAHGGGIDVASPPGKGSEFSVVLPINGRPAEIRGSSTFQVDLKSCPSGAAIR